MSCNTLTNILNDCNNNLGGIISVYLTDLNNIDTITISDHFVSDLALITGFEFTKFEFTKDSAQYDVDSKVDRTGIEEFDHSLKFKISKRNSINFTNISKLTEGNRSLVALVKTRNNSWMLLGYEYGLICKGIKGGSGSSIGSGPLLELSFDGMQRDFELQVDNTVAEMLTN